MTDILSQDEIDQLLNAISSGDIQPEEFSQQAEQKKVKIYDFKRPDKFSKDQIRTVQMMHETFARLTTTALSAKLRSMVGVHVTSVDQLTYEEFIRSIPNPTTLALINMDPLKGSAILEVDPAITFTIIDRLFGGTGEHYKINRELTDIELSVIEGIVVHILGNLREAWSTVIDLRPRLGTIETNPQFAQIVPPNEMVMLITLETKIGESEGMMNLCIPYITIEPIIAKLSAQYWFSSIRRGESEVNMKIIQNRLENVEVEVRVEVGEAMLPFSEFINLEVGETIKLNTRVHDDFTLRVGERPKYKCRPGRVGAHLAVQIGEEIHEVPDEFLITSRSQEDY
ncbi:MAG: flagellar motor switch protein FliM [Spirochaetia bacterium]|nr:flagellar motor switch protein FliM [Spirochaetia bacterium]